MSNMVSAEHPDPFHARQPFAPLMRAIRRVQQIPEAAMDWAVAGAYLSLIALLAAAQTAPRFRALFSHIPFRINDLVRGFLGR